MKEQIREIKEEDLKYIKDALNYALDGPVKNNDHQTHFNLFANAIGTVEASLNSPPISQTNSLLIAMIESQLKVEKVKQESYLFAMTEGNPQAGHVFNGLLLASSRTIEELERQLKELKE